MPPPFYYGREYPVPVDPFHPHNLPAQSELLHRYGAPPPVSPRLMESYRRAEHGGIIHSREYEAAELRRFEERREKEKEGMIRSPSIDLLKRKHEEMMNGEWHFIVLASVDARSIFDRFSIFYKFWENKN